MRKQRKNYTPKEKVSILRKHLVEGTAVLELCDPCILRQLIKKHTQTTFSA